MRAGTELGIQTCGIFSYGGCPPGYQRCNGNVTAVACARSGRGPLHAAQASVQLPPPPSSRAARLGGPPKRGGEMMAKSRRSHGHCHPSVLLTMMMMMTLIMMMMLCRYKADQAFQVGSGKSPVGAYLDIDSIVQVR
jgi:hypothetical protein